MQKNLRWSFRGNIFTKIILKLNYGHGNLPEYKFGSILTLKGLKNFLSPILVIFGHVDHQACTNDLYFDDFFTQPVRPKIAKNCQNSNSKIGRQIFVFEQNLLNFL